MNEETVDDLIASAQQGNSSAYSALVRYPSDHTRIAQFFVQKMLLYVSSGEESRYLYAAEEMAKLLITMGARAAGVQAVCVQMLRNERQETRRLAVAVMSALTPAGSLEHVPEARRLLAESDPVQRQAGLAILQACGPKLLDAHPEILGEIEHCLEDGHPLVRMQALATLKAMGPAAAAALPAIRLRRHDRHRNVSVRAAEALRAIAENVEGIS